MSNKEVKALVNKIQKMETVFDDDDREVYREKDGTLYEIDFDGTEVLAIYNVDEEGEIINTVYENESFC